MRACGRVALCGLAFGLAVVLAASAADEPPPLLKAVTPPKTHLRVRVPVEGGSPQTTQFRAQVPNGKKKSELLDAAVALDSQPGLSYISAKKLESWGYQVPQKRVFVLPELFVPAVQVAPKPEQGRDVVVRLTNIKLHVVETPAGAPDKIFKCDLSLTTTELYKGAERTMEPRLAFADHFLEFTVNPTAVKRLGTDDMAVPEVTADSTPTLVPAVGPTVMRRELPMFAYASINGMESFKMPNGTVIPVNVGVASINNWTAGVVVTIGVARGCKVEMDQTAEKTAVGVEAKTQYIAGKVKELRLGFYTGPDLKAQKDFVIKDLPVMVDKNTSDTYVWLGPKFIETYFKDGVYAAGSDGVWKMYGRLDPELLFDIKTRKKPDPQEPKKDPKVDPKKDPKKP